MKKLRKWIALLLAVVLVGANAVYSMSSALWASEIESQEEAAGAQTPNETEVNEQVQSSTEGVNVQVVEEKTEQKQSQPAAQKTETQSSGGQQDHNSEPAGQEPEADAPSEVKYEVIIHKPEVDGGTVKAWTSGDRRTVTYDAAGRYKEEVAEGTAYNIEITADAGYEIDKVTGRNGDEISPAGTDGNISTYTIAGIAEDKEIFISFREIKIEKTENNAVLSSNDNKTDERTDAGDTAETESIKIRGNNKVMAGQSVELYADVEPEDAAGDITWTSSDPSAAEVTAEEDSSRQARVTGVKAGEVTVTAATQDGKVNSSFKITVKEKYTVNYYDQNNLLVKSEEVQPGAFLQGYTFTAPENQSFLGWYWQGRYLSNDEITQLEITSDMNLHAVCVNIYTVTYRYGWDGAATTKSETEHVTAGGQPQAVPSVIKASTTGGNAKITAVDAAGYVFTGWKNEETGEVVNNPAKAGISSDTTYVAQYEKEGGNKFTLRTGSSGVKVYYAFKKQNGTPQDITDLAQLPVGSSITMNAAGNARILFYVSVERGYMTDTVYAPVSSNMAGEYFSFAKKHPDSTYYYFADQTNKAHEELGCDYWFTFGTWNNGNADRWFTITANPVKHTVVYDTDGGTPEPADTNKYTIHDTVTLSSERPEKTGYTFAGWKLEQTGDVYQPGSRIVMDEIYDDLNGSTQLKFTAQWKEHEQRIEGTIDNGTARFVSDEAADEAEADNEVIGYVTSAGRSPEVSFKASEGYFISKVTVSKDGQTTTNRNVYGRKEYTYPPQSNVTTDIIVNVETEAEDAYIIFHRNDGSENDIVNTLTGKTGQTLVNTDMPSDIEGPEGYVFEGWYKTKECEEGDKVTKLPSAYPAGETHYYAKWVRDTSVFDAALKGYEGVYDADRHGITFDISDKLLAGEAVSYETESAGKTEDNPQFTDVTEQKVTVTVTDKEHGNTVWKGTASVKITPAELSVKTEGAEKVYDGDKLTAAGNISGFVKGETAAFEVTGSQTEVGGSLNTYDITWNGSAKKDNYIVKEDLGTLKVTEYAEQITVTTTGGIYTYDGAEHKAKVEVSQLPKGYYVEEASTDAKAADVTKEAVEARCDKLVIKNVSGEDVTGKLNITYKNGSIVVNPARLTVVTESAEKPYDGGALKAGGKMDGLVNGETAAFTVTGSQTKAGSSTNTYKIDWNGTAKESNYAVHETLGTLTVLEYADEIVVLTESGEFTYDGSEHKAVVEVRNLPAGYSAEAYSDAAVTDVTADKVTAACDHLVIKNADGQDITTKLRIRYVDGSIQVNPAVLTAVTYSADKEYDGTALTADGSISGFADNEDAEFAVTGTQTDAGTSLNDYDIRWTNAKESNYVISETKGTLKVDPKKVTITVDDSRKLYGEPDSPDSYTGSISPALVSGSDLGAVTYKRTGAGGDDNEKVGIYKEVLTADYTSNSNYDVTVVPGTFEIAGQITYDGNGSTSGPVPADGAEYSYKADIQIMDRGELKRDGALFLGWSTVQSPLITTQAMEEEAMESIVGASIKMGRESVVLYAVWAVDIAGPGAGPDDVPDYKEFKVTYDGNGDQVTGSVEDTGLYEENYDYTVKDNGFQRAGYVFDGWNTQADGNGMSVKPGESYTITGDVTFYAQWEEDVIGEGENPNEPDGIPDRYQAVVYFEAVNGTVSIDKTVVTLYDMDGNPSELGIGTLQYTAEARAAGGYTQSSLTWTPQTPLVGMKITGTRTFTAEFDREETPAAVTPGGTTPGGTTPDGTNPGGTAPDGNNTVTPAAVIQAITEPVAELAEGIGNAIGDNVRQLVQSDDEGVPLANRASKDHKCCILHFLLVLLALIVEIEYTRSMKKRQRRIFELREEIALADKDIEAGKNQAA